MKSIKYILPASVICFILTLAASAQGLACFKDTNPAPVLIAQQMPKVAGQTYEPPPLIVRDPNRVPVWEPSTATLEQGIRINPLDRMTWQFFMPVRGRCIGAFEAYVDTNKAAEIGRQVVGRYTGVPMDKPTGDVEVLILTPQEFNAWDRGHSTTTRGGSQGRSTGEMFTVDLAPGWYYLVVSNRDSMLTGKRVNLLFGGTLPVRNM